MEYFRFICAASYIISAFAYIFFLFFQKEKYLKAGFHTLLLSFVLHSFLIFEAFIDQGHLPAYNMKGTILIASWSIALVFIIMKFRYNVKVLGTFAIPFTCILFLLAVKLPETSIAMNPSYKSLWVIIHVAAMFAGEGALALACALSILYLIQENAIKHKIHGFFFKRLPPLEILDSTSNICINTGFAIITLGFVTGLVFAKITWGHFVSFDPKEVLSGITWLTYATLIHGRLTMGWRGRKSAIMSILGFCLVIFTFVGVNLLFEGHHGKFTNF